MSAEIVDLAPLEANSRLLSFDGKYMGAHIEPRRMFAVRSPGALIHAESSFLVSDNGFFYRDLSHRNYDPMWWFNEQDPKRWGFKTAEELRSNVCAESWPPAQNGVFLPPMGNFGHFMFEMLPRLSLLSSLPVGNVFTTNRLPKRFLDFAKLLFPEINFTVVPHSSFYIAQSESWVVSAPMGRGERKQLAAALLPFAEIRRRASLLKGHSNGSWPDKIYVSRGQRGLERRVVENEEAVITVLKERGYVVLDPASMSWVDQVSAFSSASEVAGVFGSHMLTCMFMPPNSRLTIAFPEGLTLNYQSYIPMLFGVHVYRSKATRSILREGHAHLDSDLIVDIDSLVRMVDAKLPPALHPFEL